MTNSHYYLISIHALLAESDFSALHNIFKLLAFLSTLSLRRATLQIFLYYQDNRFLSTLSLRRATYLINTYHRIFGDFYPRSPCGERRRNSQNINRGHTISIHALLAESDVVGTVKLADAVLFLSTLSLRRATASNRTAQQGQRISIHALLAESDYGPILTTIYLTLFLSTLSLRRATQSGVINRNSNFISIHALLAESDQRR